eukprot:1099459-Prymnesium_polylepis.1
MAFAFRPCRVQACGATPAVALFDGCAPACPRSQAAKAAGTRYISAAERAAAEKAAAERAAAEKAAAEKAAAERAAAERAAAERKARPSGHTV